MGRLPLKYSGCPAVVSPACWDSDLYPRPQPRGSHRGCNSGAPQPGSSCHEAQLSQPSNRGSPSSFLISSSMHSNMSFCCHRVFPPGRSQSRRPLLYNQVSREVVVQCRHSVTGLVETCYFCQEYFKAKNLIADAAHYYYYFLLLLLLSSNITTTATTTTTTF